MLSSPFSSEPVDEVHLAKAPLVRVVAQVRYPSLTVFQGANPIGPFAERVGRDYPVSNEWHEMQLLVTPKGVTQQQSNTRGWQLRDADQRWQVVVSETFLAMETSRYSSRSEFIERFTTLVEAFEDAYSPPFAERLGIRYTNQLVGDELVKQVPELVRPEALGGMAVPLAGATLQLSLTESKFTLDRHGLQVRWGALPPGTTFDPQLTAPAEQSWVLDVDSFMSIGTVGRQLEFAASSLRPELDALADRAYRMFRWIVTDRYLELFRDSA